jgi:uncharacterized membrane protein
MHILWYILRKVCLAHSFIHIEHIDENFEKNHTFIFFQYFLICVLPHAFDILFGPIMALWFQNI